MLISQVKPTFRGLLQSQRIQIQIEIQERRTSYLSGAAIPVKELVESVIKSVQFVQRGQRKDR